MTSLTPGGYKLARRSRSHGPMLPPTEDTLEAIRRHEQSVAEAKNRRIREDAEYERVIADKAARKAYLAAAVACPICSQPSNGNVCPACLHHEAVATRDLLEGFE